MRSLIEPESVAYAFRSLCKHAVEANDRYLDLKKIK